MTLELSLVVALLIAGVIPLLRHWRSVRKGFAWMMLGGMALSGGAAVWWSQRLAVQETELRAFTAKLPEPTRPGGYVSSDRCRACHESQYQSWHRTYHRTMTQVASEETVLGKCEDVSLEWLGKTYKLQHRGGEFWAEMEDPDWERDPANPNVGMPNAADGAPRVQKRLGLMTGSHHMQVYWVGSRFGNAQLMFPFAWLKDDQRWAPFQDTFLRDPGMPPQKQTWNMVCINCHSTGGQPRPDPVTNIPQTRVGELGIACEACHGPGEAHIAQNQNPLNRYRNHASHTGGGILNPARGNLKANSQICGSCHGIKYMLNSAEWRQEGITYRPGDNLDDSSPIVRPTKLAEQPYLKEALRSQPTFVRDRYWRDGMVRVSGRDFNGLVESPCYKKGELSCMSCHSLHHSDPTNQIKEGMAGNQACLQCHSSYASRIQEHTHHLPGSSGSSCYNCHMPYTTYGLLKGIRSHQISVPSVKESIQVGRPNACNLCHLDKSLGWSDRHLTKWYGQGSMSLTPQQETIAASILWTMKGDAGQRALLAWSMGWEPARQASGQTWIAPYLTQLLGDPYSAVRYIARRSLRSLPGFTDFSADFVQPPEQQSEAQKLGWQIWGDRPDHLQQTGPSLLLDSKTGWQRPVVEQLVRERDNQPVDLQE